MSQDVGVRVPSCARFKKRRADFAVARSALFALWLFWTGGERGRNYLLIRDDLSGAKLRNNSEIERIKELKSNLKIT